MSKIQLPVVVTPSRIELGLRCYRRHTISDVLQMVGYYSPSLEFGSVIHAGAAAWWNNANIDGNISRGLAVKAVSDEWVKRFELNPQVSQKDVSLDMAVAMIESYTKLADMRGPFALEEGDWQLVTVEDRLEVPLLLGKYPNGVLSFQTDRVVFNRTNDHLVIVDTKTASRLDKRWMRQWETSLQMKLYKAGSSKAYDIPPENVSVVVEGVLKNLPSNIAYVECPNWSTGLLNEAISQAQSIAKRDFELLVGDSELWNVPRDAHLVTEDALTKTAVNYMSCHEYGVECPFFKLCTADPEDRVAILNAEYFGIKEEDSGY